MGCASIFFWLEGYLYLEAPVTNTPLVISQRSKFQIKWCSKHCAVFRKNSATETRFD